VLTFSEPVQAGNGNIVLTPTTGAAVNIPAVDSQVVYSSSAVVIDPPSPLRTEGMQYTVTVAPGTVKDSSNNTFAGVGGTTYRFTVADTVAPTWRRICQHKGPRIRQQRRTSC
jgi:hypothetical protein